MTERKKLVRLRGCELNVKKLPLIKNRKKDKQLLQNTTMHFFLQVQPCSKRSGQEMSNFKSLLPFMKPFIKANFRNEDLDSNANFY